MVKLRMARLGRPHRPFYRINAVDSRVKRDGAVIENLGWYNPMANTGEKTHELNAERLKYWLSVGAQPSDTVKNMLAKIELVDAGVIAARRTKRIEAKKANETKKAAIAASAKKEEKK